LKKFVVLHVIEKLNDEEGGLYNIVENLCRFLPKVKSVVLTDKIKDKEILNNFKCSIFKINSFLKLFFFIKDYKYNVIHIHGIWSPINTFVPILAILFNKPFIISPQGMLEPWALSFKKIKKFFFLHFIWKFIFLKSKKIIFTSNQEYKNFKKLNIIQNYNFEVIPNGFYIEGKNDIVKNKKKINKLLFLSRIHKKKGIEILIEVFKELNPPSWNLEIIGTGEKKFVEKLKQKSGKNFINKKIFFLGFKNSHQKKKYFKSSDIFVLPSYSENFGIVVPEALSFGVPVLTTKSTPWKDLKENNCGWWINTGKVSLKKTLKKIFILNQKQISKMRIKAKRLSKNYEWPKVAKKFENTYYKLNNL